MSGSTWVNFIQNLCCHRDGSRKRSYIAVAHAELLPQRNSLTYERFRLTSTLLVTLIPFHSMEQLPSFTYHEGYLRCRGLATLTKRKDDNCGLMPDAALKFRRSLSADWLSTLDGSRESPIRSSSFLKCFVQEVNIHLILSVFCA